jgi:transposase InsO family protein
VPLEYLIAWLTWVIASIRDRNLALTPGGRFGEIRFLIRDRGPDFTASSGAVFQATGARIVRSAVQAPRMNATCERLAGTLRRELLDRVLIPGERHLHAVLTEYQVHYNTARPTRASRNTFPATNAAFPTPRWRASAHGRSAGNPFPAA